MGGSGGCGRVCDQGAAWPLVTAGCLGTIWSSSDHLEDLGIPGAPRRHLEPHKDHLEPLGTIWGALRQTGDPKESLGPSETPGTPQDHLEPPRNPGVPQGLPGALKTTWNTL